MRRERIEDTRRPPRKTTRLKNIPRKRLPIGVSRSGILHPRNAGLTRFSCGCGRAQSLGGPDLPSAPSEGNRSGDPSMTSNSRSFALSMPGELARGTIQALSASAEFEWREEGPPFRVPADQIEAAKDPQSAPAAPRTWSPDGR